MHTFQINGLIQFAGVFYMFQISCVHHQEDLLYMQLFMVCFSCILMYVSLARLLT